MSTAGGGVNIVRDGLVFYVDAANPRSYISGTTTWTDLSIFNYNGTLTNSPTFNPLNSGSIVFDGVDDFVPLTSVINNGQNFSVFTWIYPGNINIRNTIFGNGYPYQSTKGWLFSTATGYGGITNSFFISIGQDEAYRTASNNSLILNKWNFVGGTVTNGGQNIKLYLNGVETSYFGGIQTIVPISYSNNESSIARRHSTNTEVFNGRISQVSIYNRVLSSSEILQNYNATRSRFGL